MKKKRDYSRTIFLILILLGILLISQSITIYWVSFHNIDTFANSCIRANDYGYNIREIGEQYGINKTMPMIDFYVYSMESSKQAIPLGIIGGLMIGFSLAVFLFRKEK